MSARLAAIGMGVVVALLAQAPAQAQGSRDPTLAPPEAGLMVPQTGGVAVAAPTPNYSVIVQDGQARLVVGTRLVAPGGMVGDAKLERITETEVWLRKGKELRKVPRFAGIQRTTTVVAPPAAACPPLLATSATSAASATKARRANAKTSLSAGDAPSGCAAVQP